MLVRPLDGVGPAPTRVFVQSVCYGIELLAATSCDAGFYVFRRSLNIMPVPLRVQVPVPVPSVARETGREEWLVGRAHGDQCNGRRRPMFPADLRIEGKIDQFPD